MSAQHSILVVEDNEDDAILVVRALRKAGVDALIRIVKDGDAAIDFLVSAAGCRDREHYPMPTLVLLDLKLPRRSGFEVLEWIRAHPTLGNLLVVVFTTSNQSTDLQKAYALGANSYLKKPTSFDATTELLRTTGLYWLTHNEKPPLVQGEM